MRLYHGTTFEGMKAIIERGFKLEAERRSDPGDFGWGIYLTGHLSRAKAIGGKYVLEVEVELKNPLVFKSISEAYKFADEMALKLGITIHGKGNTPEERFQDRVKNSKKWREYFLRQGYDGIIIYDPDPLWKGAPYEVVVFDLSAIKSVKPVPIPYSGEHLS